MMFPDRRSFFSLLFVVILISGCAGNEETKTPDVMERDDDGKLLVYTVNYPLQYFAERIGGDLARVEFPVPADVDPAFWSPGLEVISEYQSADLILLNGAGYAKWTERVSLPLSKMIYTSAGFADRYLAVDDAVTHSHGPGGEHDHGETAFTTWLDPTLAAEQAEAVFHALSLALPDDIAAMEERYNSLAEDLEELDRSTAAIVERTPQLLLLASHPVYQYFARRYELNLRSVHFEPDEMPAIDGWNAFRALRAEHPAEWMLWEAEPLAETTERLNALGVASAVFDPCGNRPESGDYLSVMVENLANLESVFAPQGP